MADPANDLRDLLKYTYKTLKECRTNPNPDSELVYEFGPFKILVQKLDKFYRSNPVDTSPFL